MIKGVEQQFKEARSGQRKEVCPSPFDSVHGGAKGDVAEEDSSKIELLTTRDEQAVLLCVLDELAIWEDSDGFTG